MASLILLAIFAVWLLAVIIEHYRNENKTLKKELVSRDLVTAKDPNTPSYVLRRLSQSESPLVREAVAENPSTPSTTLSSLASDSEYHVVVEVACNANTALETLLSIVESKRENLSIARKVASTNPKLPSGELERLSISDDNDIRFGIAQNPSTPTPLLDALASDKNWHVRMGVVLNANTSLKTLETFANGDDDYFREEARRALKRFT